LNSDHIPPSILKFTHKGYKYKLQTINRQRKREQTVIAINIACYCVAVITSCSQANYNGCGYWWCGSGQVISCTPCAPHDFLYVKITIVYVISTHKNSVIITEKACYLKCINMTLKICHYNMAVFAVPNELHTNSWLLSLRMLLWKDTFLQVYSYV